jgi:hypothetical protein
VQQATHYEPYYGSSGPSDEKKNGRVCSPLLTWLAVLAYLAILALGGMFSDALMGTE